MRYWPLSVIRTSPLLPGDCVAELDALYQNMSLSRRTFDACAFVANRTEAVAAGGLVVIENDDHSVLRLAYLKCPTPAEWERLERAHIIEAPGRLIFMLNPLH
jgi:hypothetical protein